MRFKALLEWLDREAATARIREDAEASGSPEACGHGGMAEAFERTATLIRTGEGFRAGAVDGNTTGAELDALLEREGLVIRSVCKLRRSAGYSAILELKADAHDIHAGTADTIPQAISNALASARDARRFDASIRKAAVRL